jgi:hypothetical protein
MVSCKEKVLVESDPDYAPKYTGSYYTVTLFDTYNTDEAWEVTKLDKNLLGITYKVVYNVTKPIKTSSTFIYTLKNVIIQDSVTIKFNENADVDRDGAKLRAKVEGTGKKFVSKGVTIIGINDLKMTDLTTNEVTKREYLEFKKK